MEAGDCCEALWLSDWLSMLYDDRDEVVTTSEPQDASSTIKARHTRPQQIFFTDNSPSRLILLRYSIT